MRIKVYEKCNYNSSKDLFDEINYFDGNDLASVQDAGSQIIVVLKENNPTQIKL